MMHSWYSINHGGTDFTIVLRVQARMDDDDTGTVDDCMHVCTTLTILFYHQSFDLLQRALLC